MIDWGHIRWVEWFSLAMLVFTLGAPVFFLIYFFRRHYLDNLDCSKYEVFTTDSALAASEQPHMPASCEPRYLSQRPWWSMMNVGWFWVTLAFGILWLLIMLGAFLASRTYG